MDELLETVKRLTRVVGTINSELLERAENLCETRDQILDTQINPYTMTVDERDDTGYKSLPILPEWREIKEDNGTPTEVRPNKVDAPYKDWMEYYDIQFRLVREDFIAPLRRGVAAFLQGVKNRDVKIYNRAKIVSQVTTIEKGICFVVKFDASGFCKAKYNWKQSKRLIFGSLLCFISRMNMFEISAMFATVAKRDIYELEKGNIMVHFEGNILSEAVNHCAMGTEFDIIESNSYFEATSPILKSLQEAEVATMPFTKQLIEGKYESVLPPAYLRETTQVPIYNLSCLHGPVGKRKNKPLMIEVLNKESWKATSNSKLDSSQLNAIQTALTQEISVIQGPPGTGKTYIGLKIVEALLDNRHIWDPLKSSPILVMCYTNHALDQFLEGIIDTECCGRKPKVIRVGGRCKNEKVNRYNLRKVREKLSKQHYLEKEKLQCNPNEVWQYLKDYFKRDTLLPLYVLQKVVHPYHYYQLTQMAQCAEQQHKEVEVWLDLWHLTSTNVRHFPNEDKDLIVVDKVGQFNDEVVQGSVKDLPEQEDDTFLIDYDRQYEGDDEGYKSAILQKYFTEKMKSQYVHPYVEDVSTSESDNDRPKVEFEGEKWVRKVNANKWIKQNLHKNSMDDEEVEELSYISIGKLSIEDRWRLYNYWEEQWYKFLQEENGKMAQEYNEKCSEINELRQRGDQHTLESADVVGMTTTGAAKYQHILHHIKPKIVIVEEAAEVLEAHIVSALSAGTQHLILIGDHKQLRPKPNEHVLATEYNLSISLFERLVRKQMSKATLEIQHRMRPEIAQLVCPHVYEKLLNHESVQKYPDIRGISKNMFFVHHSEPESEHPGLLSYQNDFEANYIVGLCAHLLRLGYSPSQITILTPYVGQLLLLRNKMPKSEFNGVHVTAIDNFQGEENDIILFSMVRSTNPNSRRTTIGFMKEDNRVCVSLSRAKHGFYAIGNFELIRHQSLLWESIISDVERRECYGNSLPLYCCNHPETKYSAQTGSDFEARAPNVVATAALENVGIATHQGCMLSASLKSNYIIILVTTAIAMNGVAGTVSTLSVAGNVQRNVTDLNAMKFVTRNCVVVTGVLDSAERDA
ncbi:NFX1-type zinc finger-containing protein 1 [Geodia barretti]|uniref:NFX1-type zinc finger-containing protein 1 n=1 Tax=Geodia barretti TaxID=519541 RepID=A0AA35X8D6_GEOBA|nr:NFX1-type zinc finger-containing protein 1 [Geodia barretti]